MIDSFPILLQARDTDLPLEGLIKLLVIFVFFILPVIASVVKKAREALQSGRRDMPGGDRSTTTPHEQMQRNLEQKLRDMLERSRQEPDEDDETMPEPRRREAPEALRREAPETLRREAPETLRREAPETLRREAPEALRREAPEPPRREAPIVRAPRPPARKKMIHVEEYAATIGARADSLSRGGSASGMGVARPMQTQPLRGGPADRGRVAVDALVLLRTSQRARRTAILLGEILGPPRSLRELGHDDASIRS
jgi:hypothetical protein